MVMIQDLAIGGVRVVFLVASWSISLCAMVSWLMVVRSVAFRRTALFVSEFSIVKVVLILDWLQNSEHVPESIRNIGIIILKNDKETYNILKKQKFFTSYPQRNPLIIHNTRPPILKKLSLPHNRQNRSWHFWSRCERTRKALLSLKDYNLKDRLPDLADAGICSFKIEGRLKNISYVRNVVRAYSSALDELVAANPEKYRRTSFGRSEGGFAPDLGKTFNRGYTQLFLDGKRSVGWSSMNAPKSIGEEVRTVVSITPTRQGSPAGRRSGEEDVMMTVQMKSPTDRLLNKRGRVFFPIQRTRRDRRFPWRCLSREQDNVPKGHWSLSGSETVQKPQRRLRKGT